MEKGKTKVGRSELRVLGRDRKVALDKEKGFAH